MYVLVIEDDPDTRRLFAHALELAGHEVVTAADGAAGLAEALARRPDLILLDLVMPVMDGWQFRARQRAVPALAAVPVVVVSGHDTTSELAAAAYLAKPCDLDELLATVRAHGPPAAPAHSA